MAKPKDTTRDDVNEGDVRASVADDPTPRPSNPQTYDGGDPITSEDANKEGSVVDNTAKDAPKPEPIKVTEAVATTTTATVEPVKHKQLKDARVRLTERAYINDVLYDEGAIIERYSGPDAPHFEKL